MSDVAVLQVGVIVHADTRDQCKADQLTLATRYGWSGDDTDVVDAVRAGIRLSPEASARLTRGARDGLLVMVRRS